MAAPGPILEIRSSPHIQSGHSVEAIMRNVVLALLPVAAFAIFAFGAAALLTLAVALASCLVTEQLFCRLGERVVVLCASAAESARAVEMAVGRMNVEVIVAADGRIPLADGSADLVTMADPGHLHPGRLEQEIVRVLGSRGSVYRAPLPR